MRAIAAAVGTTGEVASDRLAELARRHVTRFGKHHAHTANAG